MRRLLILLLGLTALFLMAACGSGGPSPAPTLSASLNTGGTFDPFAGLPTNPAQPSPSPCPVYSSAEMSAAAAGHFRLEATSLNFGLVDSALVVDTVSQPGGRPLELAAAKPAPVDTLPDLGPVVAGQSAAFALYQDLAPGDTLVFLAQAASARLEDGSSVTISVHGSGLVMAYPALAGAGERTLTISLSWNDNCHKFAGTAAFRFHNLP